MDFIQFASVMYPNWILGFGVFCLVMSTKERKLLKINWKGLFCWASFLLVLSVFRIAMVKAEGVPEDMPPLISMWTTLFVWWEDMAHAVPLALFKRLVGKKYKYIYNILLLMTMFSFGLGHIWQSPFAAVLLSAYIPLAVRAGEKYGFGTVMIAHMAYDFCTELFLHYCTKL